MITFNIQAHNGNYYRGHKPANKHGNCWSGEQEDALVFTIEQARELVKAWQGYLEIVISVAAEPISDDQFKHELFCSKGGRWYDYNRNQDDESS